MNCQPVTGNIAASLILLNRDRSLDDDLNSSLSVSKQGKNCIDVFIFGSKSDGKLPLVQSNETIAQAWAEATTSEYNLRLPTLLSGQTIHWLIKHLDTRQQNPSSIK